MDFLLLSKLYSYLDKFLKNQAFTYISKEPEQLRLFSSGNGKIQGNVTIEGQKLFITIEKM